MHHLPSTASILVCCPSILAHSILPVLWLAVLQLWLTPPCFIQGFQTVRQRPFSIHVETAILVFSMVLVLLNALLLPSDHVVMLLPVAAQFQTALFAMTPKLVLPCSYISRRSRTAINSTWLINLMGTAGSAVCT